MTTELYEPDAPGKLTATSDDIAALEALAARIGWHEFMFRVGQLLMKGCQQATGHRQSALRGVANHVNFIVPGVHWCDVELDLRGPVSSSGAEP